jgi:putative ABC transport system permease protein
MEFFDFWYTKVSDEAARAIDGLNDGKNIVIGAILKGKLGLDIGDTVTLRLTNGAGEYIVTGFIDSNYGIGHIGFISAENFISDFGAENYSKILIKSDGDPEATKNNILRAFSKDVMAIQTKAEEEAANSDKVMSIFNAINTYAYFAMLIGLLGIVNNMAASFLSRRRNLAMYRCIGMPKRGAARMLMTEAMTIGVVGVCAGLAIGLLSTGAVPFLVGMAWGNVAVIVPVMRIMALCICGITAMLACSLIPLANNRKLSVMDNIRYE